MASIVSCGEIRATLVQYFVVISIIAFRIFKPTFHRITRSAGYFVLRTFLFVDIFMLLVDTQYMQYFSNQLATRSRDRLVLLSVIVVGRLKNMYDGHRSFSILLKSMTPLCERPTKIFLRSTQGNSTATHTVGAVLLFNTSLSLNATCS